jgi:hypothetical protein
MERGQDKIGRTSGLYDRLRFVVRLRPDIYQILQDAEPAYLANEASARIVDAFASYLHETIHWWQHIGTTSGLILSFCSPAKTHINRRKLLSLLATDRPQKSLLELSRFHYDSLTRGQQIDLNFVLAHWHHLEFNLRHTLFPQNIDDIAKSPYFESLGHTAYVALADTLWMLAATFDSDYRVVPDVRLWDQAFAELAKRNVKGFYYGSPIVLPPIGANAVFEGQARFSQLQYLYLATDGKLSWNEFAKRRLLGKKYVEAFQLFLSATGAAWPESPVSSEVQLFLLLCDLALNPGDGYPFDLLHPEASLVTNNPSMRFWFFCREIPQQPSLLRFIRQCSHQEYQEVARRLCMSMACKTPTEISAEIVRWSASLDSLKTLLHQEESFAFPNENLPVKVYFSKHLRFSAAKLDSPHFFCWPAMFLVEHDLWDVDLFQGSKIFARHLPMFVATLDGKIRIAPLEKTPTPDHSRTFNAFYGWVIQYDLVDQWIARQGPFDLTFTDIHPTFVPETIKPIAEAIFAELWGVALDDFILVAM